ncbi:MAG: family 78 glycoside hydrolase catalytic domain [Kiritimatiellae bacterium]|nr:family 78 glycoside hydrolase catalytic domain [Kiritimatiellia bacterium]
MKRGLVGVVCCLAICMGCESTRSVHQVEAVSAPCDWQGARWIGDGLPQPERDEDFYKDDPAPIFRRHFPVTKKVDVAHLHVVGLGLYAATLNGVPLHDGLAPLWTPFGTRVLYDTYDVSKAVQRGDNEIRIALGNGWYNPLPLRMWGRFNLRSVLAVGRPCLIAKLDVRYADGSREEVVSDTTWQVATGAVVRNSLYLGETYDARREGELTWRPAVAVAGPAGALQPRLAPPVCVYETWRAKQVTEPTPGVYVVDMGRNFAGVAQINLGVGARGERIVFRYGELLNKDGTVNGLTGVCGQIKRAGVGGAGAPAVAEQRDEYIRRGGEPERYRPRFTWHGFRYVQIEGLASRPRPEDVTAYALASAVKDASRFECSEPMLNRLHRVCRDTFLGNLMGVQSDCPARERFGYGADIAATTEAFIFQFDMRTFYAKTIQDFADEAAQDGWFTETAPYVGIADRGFGGRSGPIGWTVGVPVMMRDLYRYYGDREVVARHYEACARYLELVKSKCPDLIVPRCIGDHEALEKAPEPLTATAHFYQWARLVADFAAILGKPEEAKKFDALADDIRAAFQKKFVVGGKVGQGRQGEQAFGLYHRLIPEADRPAALEMLRKDIEAHDGALTTGIFGTKYLLDVLSTEGLEEWAGKLAVRREFPSWGYMLDNGATTLWETWKPSDNTYSQNHPMFGSVDEWMMKHVLGIEVPDDAVGCNKVMIRPKPVAGLTWARGSYDTPHGPLRVDWKLDADQMKLTVEVPDGVCARVWLAAEKKWVEARIGKNQW